MAVACAAARAGGASYAASSWSVAGAAASNCSRPSGRGSSSATLEAMSSAASGLWVGRAAGASGLSSGVSGAEAGGSLVSGGNSAQVRSNGFCRSDPRRESVRKGRSSGPSSLLSGRSTDAASATATEPFVGGGAGSDGRGFGTGFWPRPFVGVPVPYLGTVALGGLGMVDGGLGLGLGLGLCRRWGGAAGWAPRGVRSASPGAWGGAAAAGAAPAVGNDRTGGLGTVEGAFVGVMYDACAGSGSGCGGPMRPDGALGFHEAARFGLTAQRSALGGVSVRRRTVTASSAGEARWGGSGGPGGALLEDAMGTKRTSPPFFRGGLGDTECGAPCN